jgi:hypothetical protein
MTREMIMKIRFGFCGDQTSKQQWFLTYNIKHHKVMNFIRPGFEGVQAVLHLRASKYLGPQLFFLGSK